MYLEETPKRDVLKEEHVFEMMKVTVNGSKVGVQRSSVPRAVKICASFVKIWCLPAAFGLCYDKFMKQKGTSKVQGGKE